MKSRSAKGGQGPPPLCSFRRGMATLMQAIAANLQESARTGACVIAVSRQIPGGASYQIRVTQQGPGRSARGGCRRDRNSRLCRFAADCARFTAARKRAFRNRVRVDGGGRHWLPQAASGRDARWLRSADSAKRRASHARHRLEFFAIPRPRAPTGRWWSRASWAARPILRSSRKTDDEIAAIVEEDHAQILDITGPPITTAVWKHAKALPQYNLGHGHVVRAIRDAEGAIPGLYFAGNYLEGPSIGKCVEQGFEPRKSSAATCGAHARVDAFVILLGSIGWARYNARVDPMATAQQKSRREVLEQFVAQKSGRRLCAIRSGAGMREAGDDAAAAGHFHKLLETNPDYSAGYFQFGQLLSRLGRLDEARRLLSDGIVVAQRAETCTRGTKCKQP